MNNGRKLNMKLLQDRLTMTRVPRKIMVTTHTQVRKSRLNYSYMVTQSIYKQH